MSYAMICTPPWDSEMEYRHDIKVAIAEEKIKQIKKILVPFSKGKLVTMKVVRVIVIYDDGKVAEI